MCSWVVLLALGGVARAVSVAHVDEARERVLENQLNQAREAAGLPPLAHDDGLRDLARYHSADMAMAGFASTVSPSEGPLARRAAAHVGVAASRIKALAATSGEVDISLLDARVTRVAIGVVEIGDRMYVTEIAVMDDRSGVDRAGILGLLERIWTIVASGQSARVDALYVTR